MRIILDPPFCAVGCMRLKVTSGGNDNAARPTLDLRDPVVENAAVCWHCRERAGTKNAGNVTSFETCGNCGIDDCRMACLHVDVYMFQRGEDE